MGDTIKSNEITKLRLITYLSPSIPVEIFEMIRDYLEAKFKLHASLIYESRWSGPPAERHPDPFTSDEVDIGFMCASAFEYLRHKNNPHIELCKAAPVYIHPNNKANQPIYYSDIIIHADNRKKSLKIRSAVGNIICSTLFLRKRRKYAFVPALHALTMWRSGCTQKLFSCFNRLGLALSVPATRNTIDRLRQMFDQTILNWKSEIEVQLLQTSQNTIVQGTPAVRTFEFEDESLAAVKKTETWHCCSSCKRGDVDRQTDHVYNYSCAVTWRGLNDLVRNDAVREGDGKAVIAHWRVDMAEFWNKNHNKYLIIGHRLLSENLKHARGRYTPEHVARTSQIVGSLGKEIDHIYHHQVVETYTYSGFSEKPGFKKQLKDFIQEYKEDNLVKVVNGRQHKAYPKFTHDVDIINPSKLKKKLKIYSEKLQKSKDILPKTEKYKEFHDLKGHKWAYNDSMSLSGSLLALAELKKMGFNSTFFGHVKQSGSNWKSIHMVLDKKVDAASIDSTTLQMAFRKTPALKKQICILTSLGPMPVQPVVFNKRLSAEMKKSITEALLNMDKEEVWKKKLHENAVLNFKPVDLDFYQLETNLRSVVQGLSVNAAYY